MEDVFPKTGGEVTMSFDNNGYNAVLHFSVPATGMQYKIQAIYLGRIQDMIFGPETIDDFIQGTDYSTNKQFDDWLAENPAQYTFFHNSYAINNCTKYQVSFYDIFQRQTLHEEIEYDSKGNPKTVYYRYPNEIKDCVFRFFQNKTLRNTKPFTPNRVYPWSNSGKSPNVYLGIRSYSVKLCCLPVVVPAKAPNCSFLAITTLYITIQVRGETHLRHSYFQESYYLHEGLWSFRGGLTYVVKMNKEDLSEDLFKFYIKSCLCINTSNLQNISGAFQPDPPLPIITVITYNIGRSFKFSQNSINKKFQYMTTYIDDTLLFSQTLQLYPNAITGDAFFSQIYQISTAGEITGKSTVVPISAANLYFMKLSVDPEISNYNTLLCLHATSPSPKAIYQIDDTIPYITSTIDPLCPLSTYHTFNKAVTTSKYYRKVYGNATVNYRMFTLSQLCSSNFINYCIYNSIGRTTNILNFSYNTNYYAEVNAGTENQPLAYYLSLIKTTEDDIKKYSPNKNTNNKNLAAKFSIDLHMFKSYLVNRTINTIFNKYSNLNGFKYNNNIQIQEPPTFINNNISYYNARYFTPIINSSAVIDQSIISNAKKNKVLYTRGHYNTALNYYNIPFFKLNYPETFQGQQIFIKYLIQVEGQTQPSAIDLYSQFIFTSKYNTRTDYTSYYSYFRKDNLSNFIFQNNIQKYENFNYYKGTINNNIVNTNYIAQALLYRKDDYSQVSAFIYRNYLYFPVLFSISGTAIFYKSTDTGNEKITELNIKTCRNNDDRQTRHNILISTFKTIFNNLKDTNDYVTIKVESGSISNPLYFCYTNYTKSSFKYLEYSSGCVGFLGYCDITIKKTNTNKNDFNALLYNYNNLYRYIGYRINQTCFNILKKMDTLAGLFSYSQLLYCDPFVIGYGNKLYNQENIKLLNKDLADNNVYKVLNSCFNQCQRLTYTSTGIKDFMPSYISDYYIEHLLSTKF